MISHHDGYLIQTDPDAIDAHRFQNLVAQANRTTDLGERDQLLRDALALWRGPALHNAASGRLHDRLCADLDEQYRQAVEASMATGLELGRHHELLPELARLNTEHPVRERFVELRMLALDRCGRAAEALSVYRQARERLADELGLDPSPALQRLHMAILRGETIPVMLPAPIQPTAAATPVRPAQLPPDQAGFTGRGEYLNTLDDLLADEAEVAGTAVVISAIAGTAGVGKTALAVYWAHRVRDRFPDGQLYVNLRGYAPIPPVRPIDALAGLLAALGVPAGRVPADPDQATGLYRSLLADRRLLIVLDNAINPDQVRPLLPAAAGCFVLITSRDRLRGLVAVDGAHPINLDVLAPDEAHDLLAYVLGAVRLAAERAAATELARVCAYLPLALRIAAANLTENPHRRIADYLNDLLAGDRLSALAIAGDEHTAIRATLDLSYRNLQADIARMFRLLGLVPGPDLTADAAAALAGISAAHAATLLERLVGAHLLTEHAPGRYSFHDLLRRYAAERADLDDSDHDRANTMVLLHRYYLDHVQAAIDVLRPDTLRLPSEAGDTDRIPPSYSDHGTASAWLDAERPNLVATIVGAGPQRRQLVWQLADALRGHFWMRAHVADWLIVARAGIAAAQGDGNLRAEAAGHLSLADALHGHGQYREALTHHRRALTLARQTGWLEGEATVLNNFGTVYQRAGQLPDAADQYRRALTVRRELHDRPGQAGPLLNLGSVMYAMGQFAGSAEHNAEAAAIFESIGSHQGLALAPGNLGQTCHRLGRLTEAGEHLSRALSTIRDVGHRGLEATILSHLAELNLETGHRQQALECLQAALAATHDLNDSRYEPGVINTAGKIHRRLGEPTNAIAHHEYALRLARQTEAPQPEVEALIGLAAAHTDLGHIETARERAHQALTLAQGSGYVYHKAQALAALAVVELTAAQTATAVRYARQARDIHQESGHRLDQAHTHVVLGHAVGPNAAGRQHWRSALALYAEIGTPDAEQVKILLDDRG